MKILNLPIPEHVIFTVTQEHPLSLSQESYVDDQTF